jgi:MFS family permease
VVSSLGDGVLLVAVPLLAARLTRDPLAISLITTFQWMPWFLFGVFAGAIADRMPPRLLMARVDVFRAVAVAALAMVVVLGTIEVWMLWIFVFVIGIGEPLFDGAAVSLMRSSVPDAQLGNANRVMFASMDFVNEFAAKPFGAFVFAAAISAPFWLDAASFAVAAALVLLVTATPMVDHSIVRTTSVLSDTREGLRWMFSQPFYRTMAGLTALANLCQGGTFALFVLYMQDRLHLSEAAIGWVFGSWAIGSLAGSAASAWWCRKVTPVGVTLGGLIVEGAGAILAVAFDSLIVFIAVNVTIAFFGTMWGITLYSYRQSSAPPELLGRAVNSFRWVIFTGHLLGGVVSGVLARAYGLTAPFYILGATLLMATALFARGINDPNFRKFRLTAHEG